MTKYTSKFTGQEIDQRLEDVVEKFGDAYFDSTANIQYLFKSTDDKLAWLSGDASIIPKVCPFEFSGTVKRMTVVNEMNSKNLLYIQMSESAIITVGFKSEEKGITDTSWNEVLEDARITVEIDRGVTGSYDTIVNEQLVLNGNTFSVDVIKYLATGNNRVRVTAVGVETGSTANIVYSALLTSMYLAPAKFAWNVPFIEGQAYSLGGLYIGGSIDKVLKIKVSNEQTYSKTYTINLGTQTNTSIAYYYNGLEFPTEGTGVYTVEMWLDANGLESEHLHYNIMCVAASDVRTAQLIAVSDVLPVAKNYNTNKLFSYAVYSGGTTSTNPKVNVSAIINNTPHPIITNEELTNVPTGEINEYIVDLEIDTQETNIQLYSSIELGESKQEAVYAIDNSASYPAVAGAVFYLNPANRSNTQANKESIVNESNVATATSEYNAAWSNVSFTDGMDGWTVDNNGRKCLRLPAKSKVEIDYAPFANATTRTLEISYKVENASDYSEDIISVASELTSQFVGARVKPTNVLLHSGLLKTDDLMQGYNTKDEELVHLLITVIKDYKQTGNLAQIYVNGVKKCSFEWSTGDSFAHNGKLIFGSETADLFVYKVRVYTEAFDWIMASKNFISCLPNEKVGNKSLKEVAYEKLHSVINDGNNIDFDKVKNGGFNYFVLRLPNGASLPSRISKDSVKHSRLEVKIQQNPSFVINGVYDDVETEGQGTTAMDYFRWNLRWKTESVRITAKKNYASSMHSHKMGATALFNDLNRMIVGANEADARVAVEQYGAYGFLEVLGEGTTDQYNYIPIGLYTIGQDKGDKATFGYNNKTYKSTLIHMEGSDHKPKAIGMDYPWSKLSVYTDSKRDSYLGVRQEDGSAEKAWEIGACGSAESDVDMLSYLTQEFYPAYDCDYRNTMMIVGVEKGTDINAQGFRDTPTPNGFTYADCLVWIDGEYDTYYYDVLSKKYTKDGNNVLSMLDIDSPTLSSMVEAISNASDDVDELLFPAIEGFTDVKVSDYKKLQASMKLGDFNTLSEVDKENFVVRLLRCREYKSTMENYWHLRDNLFHYCFIVLFAATDNFKKNTYPYKFGTLESGSRWRWRQDDLDTLADINNQGLATKIYSILNGDKSLDNQLFNGNTSYHWTNIQFYYENDIKSMMNEILTAMATLSNTGGSLIEKALGCVRKYFWDKAQDYFTKSVYNIDAEWSYEEAWAEWKNGLTLPVHPLQQSLGSHYEAERAWFELRFMFMASMFGFGAFGVGNGEDNSLGQISFRLGKGLSEFEFTPAVDMNPTILIGKSNSVNAGKRVRQNEKVSLPISTTESDTSIYIQAADYLNDIGDFSKVNLYPDNPALTIQSKRLQKLKVGDENPSEVTTVLKTLNILSCPSLSEVDARNVSTLTGTVDLSNCPRLTKALFGGSSAGEIMLPKGSKIEEFELPNTLTNLSLVNLPSLDSEGLKHGELNALTYIRLENNAKIDGFALLKATYEAGSPLTNIRIIGFDYDGTSSDVALLATLANGGYFGIDADGSRNPNIIPVIEGTLNIAGSVYEDDANVINQKYGANLVLNVTGGYYIKFEDPEWQKLAIEKYSTDKVGLTQEDADNVTNLKSLQGNTTITHLDDLYKFRNLKTFDSYCFTFMSSLVSINYPTTVTLLPHIAQQSTNLTNVIISSNNVTNIPLFFLNSSAILKFVLPDSVISLMDRAFENQTFSDLVLGKSFTKIEGRLINCIVNNLYIDSVKHWLNIDIIGTNPVGTNTTFYIGQIEAIRDPNKGNQIDHYNWDKLEGTGDYADKGEYEGKRQLVTTEMVNEALKDESITEIKNYTFYNCTQLEGELVIPSNITSIGESAFYGCTSLVINDVNLPNLTSLGANVFRSTKVKNVTNLGTITTIGAYCFHSSALESINIPNTVTAINAECLRFCSKLKTCTIPDSVITVQSLIFGDCKSLESVVIGSGVTDLGDRVFENCSNLKYVILKPVVPPTVYRISAMNSVIFYVPDESVEAYKTNSSWGSYTPTIKPLSEYVES